VELFSPHIGTQIVDLGSVLLLITCFTIVALRRLSSCVNVFALQSVFLALTAAFIAFFTGIHHIYIAALLTIVIKAVVIPRILKKVIRRIDVDRELEMNINVPTSLLICGALVILAFFITQPIIPLGFLLTRDSLSIALAIILIGLFVMIARKQPMTQVIGFLIMENGLFLAATAAAYGMPLIVELGVFFDVLVGVLIIGIYTHQLQDTLDDEATSKLTTVKGK
jgi:hydrogenase-4 component E